MSTTVTVRLACPGCGREQEALLPESANVQRAPRYREEVLARTFMRLGCTGCALQIVVERDLLYSDLQRGLFIGVFPRDRRQEAQALGQVVARAFRSAFVEQAPGVVRRSAGAVECRVVFGYDELREKVVCRDGGLDDRIVEAVKLALIDALGAAGHALLLERADEEALHFTEHARGRVRAHEVPRAMYADMAARREGIQALLPALFDGPYVHFERCQEVGG